MTDKYRAQTGFVVELGFKRKNAEHQIEKARHLFDSAAIPGPNLRADVVNYSLFRRLLPQRAGQTQIETRIVDQDHGVGFGIFDLAKRFAKLFSKETVVLNDFPQTEAASSIQFANCSPAIAFICGPPRPRKFRSASHWRSERINSAP